MLYRSVVGFVGSAWQLIDVERPPLTATTETPQMTKQVNLLPSAK